MLSHSPVEITVTKRPIWRSLRNTSASINSSTMSDVFKAVDTRGYNRFSLSVYQNTSVNLDGCQIDTWKQKTTPKFNESTTYGALADTICDNVSANVSGGQVLQNFSGYAPIINIGFKSNTSGPYAGTFIFAMWQE